LCVILTASHLQRNPKNVINNIIHVNIEPNYFVLVFYIQHACVLCLLRYSTPLIILKSVYIFRSIISSLCCDSVYKSCHLPEIPVALGSKNGSTKPFASLFRYQLS